MCVIVLDLRRGPRLAEKALPLSRVGGNPRLHDLQGDGADEQRVLGEEDDDHAPLA